MLRLPLLFSHAFPWPPLLSVVAAQAPCFVAAEARPLAAAVEAAAPTRSLGRVGWHSLRFLPKE